MYPKKFTVVVAVCALSLWVIDGCTSRTSAQVAQTKRRVGLSVPSQVAQISAEQAGPIATMRVAQGDAVKTGDVICQQSNRLQTLEVERLRALAESDHRLRQAVAELEYLRIETDRVRKLAKSEIASESVLRAQELEHEMARLKVDLARLDQTTAKNALSQAEVRLAQRTIVSPIDGVVTQLFKNKGETTEELAPIAEVIQLDPLWIEFEVKLHEGPLFKNGTEVIVSPSSSRQTTRSARIVYVSLKANPSSHSFMVRAAVPNPKRDWQAGLKMLVRTTSEYAASVQAKPRPPK